MQTEWNYSLLDMQFITCTKNIKFFIEICNLKFFSLFKVQNEGVVNTVLRAFENNRNFDLKVEPLEDIKLNLEYFFKFSNVCKMGLVVSPDVNKNFGPFYLCKLTKLAK